MYTIVYKYYEWLWKWIVTHIFNFGNRAVISNNFNTAPKIMIVVMALQISSHLIFTVTLFAASVITAVIIEKENMFQK